MKTDTPRTDAEEERMRDAGCGGIITVGFVRQLERELAELKSKYRMHHDEAERLTREIANAESDRKQSDVDSIRALHERNEAREQRDRLAEAMTEMWAFIEEDYFPNCVTQSFESAVQKYNTALAAVKESPTTTTP